MTRWREAAIALSIAAAVSSLALVVPPVGDDWSVLAYAAKSVISGSVAHDVLLRRDVHWSPLWFLLNAGAYALSPNSYGILPLAVAKCLALALLLTTAMVALRRLGATLEAAVAAALLLAFHQAGVGAFYGWKAAGGLCATALGATAAAVMLVDTLDDRLSATRSAAAAALLFAALLFKETGLAFGVFIALLTFVSRRAWRRTAAPLVGCLAFAALRAAAPVGIALRIDDNMARYGIASPVQWVKNEAQLLLAAATPISTVRWFEAVRATNWPLLLILAAITLAAALAIACKTSRSDALIVAGLLTAGFPVVLLQHVSETYVQPTIFWLALLAGLALHRAGRAAAIAFVVLFAMHLFFFADKLTMVIGSGRREVRAMQCAIPPLRTIPAGSVVVIEAPARSANDYSLYRGFHPEQAIGFAIVHERIPINANGDLRAVAAYRIDAGDVTRVVKAGRD